MGLGREWPGTAWWSECSPHWHARHKAVEMAYASSLLGTSTIVELQEIISQHQLHQYFPCLRRGCLPEVPQGCYGRIAWADHHATMLANGSESRSDMTRNTWSQQPQFPSQTGKRAFSTRPRNRSIQTRDLDCWSAIRGSTPTSNMLNLTQPRDLCGRIHGGLQLVPLAIGSSPLNISWPCRRIFRPARSPKKAL